VASSNINTTEKLLTIVTHGVTERIRDKSLHPLISQKYITSTTTAKLTFW